MRQESLDKCLLFDSDIYIIIEEFYWLFPVGKALESDI